MAIPSKLLDFKNILLNANLIFLFEIKTAKQALFEVIWGNIRPMRSSYEFQMGIITKFLKNFTKESRRYLNIP